MMAIWTLARKELRLLLRDPRAALLLLGMPLLFILILGLLLGEGFGQKPEQRLRVSLVNQDQGFVLPESLGWLTLTPSLLPLPSAVSPQELAALTLAAGHDCARFPLERWSDIVLRDLQETSGIRVEIMADRETAKRLCRDSTRPAVLVLGPWFSLRLAQCSFLTDGINPFFRDGIKMEELDAELIRDKTQKTGASVIDQVAQVTLLRVVLPWMIGKAFGRLSDPDFIERLGNQVRLPVPQGAALLFQFRGVQLVDGKATLNEVLHVASLNRRDEEGYREKVGQGIQTTLATQFRKYNLTGLTWGALTQSDASAGDLAEVTLYRPDDARYQLLVPSYTVMFAFALTLVVGWLFVSERRQGTLKRLLAAPLTRSQLLLGKFLPCLFLAIFQGFFLLAAGKLVFRMAWGPESWPWSQQVLWLIPVVLTTALAAMGLALVVAAAARTEMQVALYGSILVLTLGLIGGCVVPRELMSQQAQIISLSTPHAWALDAYRQLLLSSDPNLGLVLRSCLILTAFGAGFLSLAWGFLRLE